MHKKLFLFLGIIGCAFYLSMGAIAQAAPTSIVVTSNSAVNISGDSQCTLGEALSNANTDSDTTSGDCASGVSGSDTITFASPMTITLTSGITITTPIIIDATSTGTCPSGQGVTINANSNSNAITLSGDADGSRISGLIIRNYSVAGITLSGISGSQTIISCNTIGLNDAGNTAAGGDEGIQIYDSSNILIGGPLATDRNTISGNQNSLYNQGVFIANGTGLTSNITIQGNYFGVDKTGMNAIPNGIGGEGQGIDIYQDTVSNITITGNLFAGGGVVTDTAPTTGLIIQSNTFDIASDGTTLIPASGTHKEIGLSLDGVTNLTIGGAVSGQGNIFAGVGGARAISISNSSTVGIYGNNIGYFADGVTIASTEGYRAFDLRISSSTDVTIGGQINTAAQNIFGLNHATSGAVFINGGSNVQITGNYIGLGSDGISTTTTGAVGVLLVGGNNNTVGGTGASDRNVIAGVVNGFLSELGGSGKLNITGNRIFNVTAGAIIATTSLAPGVPSYTTLSQNNIRATSMAIELSKDSNGDQAIDTDVGSNKNDHLDADTGPNDYLNRPVIISATQSGLDTIVTYMLDVPVSANPYRTEFFTNPSGIVNNGFGVGEVFKGYDEQTISSSGVHVFTTTLVNATAADGVTATVTSCTDGICSTFSGTSEFSNSSTGGVDLGTATGTETDLEDNGPYHIITSGVSLGATVDADTPTSVDSSDKDGVVFNSATYLPNATVTTSVTASTNGYLSIWLDANNDGDFEDTDEDIVVNESVTSGAHDYTFTAPSADGTYPVRFRFTSYSEPSIAPTGEALDGEVEDYVLTVATPAVSGGGAVAVFGCMDRKAANYNPNAMIDNNSCVLNGTTPVTTPTNTNSVPTTSVRFTKTLKQGMTDAEVKLLQVYLNTHGFPVAANGVGAPGKETTYFGNRTTAALIKYQEAHKASILAPLGLTRGTGVFGPATQAEFAR